MLLGTFLSVLNSWLISNVIPTVYYRKHRMVADVASQFFAKTNPVNNLINLSGFRMKWRKKEGGKFIDVWIELKKPGICGHAEEVWIEPPKSGRVRIFFKGFRGLSGGKMIDENVDIFQASAECVDIEVDIGTLLLGRQRRLRFHDMTSAQMVSELRSGRIWKPRMAMWRLHFRMCHGLIALLFSLIGPAIGILFRKGGRMAAFGLSFFPIMLYYITVYFCEGLVAGGSNPVFLGWTPGFVLFAIAIYLNWRVFRI